MAGQSDQRSKERGGVRRYFDTVTPEEYVPQTGEVDLTEISLTGLADLYGSDKGTIKHNYTHIYEQILRELGVTHRKTHSLRLAEIGVACGASLRMWANHLPAATIEGFDIQPECANLCKDLKNVTITISDPRQVNREGFDRGFGANGDKGGGRNRPMGCGDLRTARTGVCPLAVTTELKPPIFALH